LGYNAIGNSVALALARAPGLDRLGQLILTGNDIRTRGRRGSSTGSATGCNWDNE